jgi:hypothetical protein
MGRSGKQWLNENFSWTRLLDKIDGLIGRTIKRP